MLNRRSKISKKRTCQDISQTSSYSVPLKRSAQFANDQSLQSGLDLLQYSAQQISNGAAALTHMNSTTKLPSPSANSSPSKNIPTPHMLKIQPDVPRYPFVGQPFVVSVHLVDGDNHMKSGWNIPLHITLLYEDNQEVLNAAEVFVFSPCNPVLPAQGSMSLSVTMNQCSLLHDTRDFKLCVMPDASLDPQYGIIHPCVSQCMTIVRHHLRITQQPPPTWFKDEGGRDKSIEIGVVLLDFQERSVANREVPLKVTLMYEGETEVKNQGILKVTSAGRPCLDSNGQTILRVRIEEVSKNHQKQPFCIRIDPDASYSPSYHDISGVVSSLVRVRSKRNRRRSGNTAASSVKVDAASLIPRKTQIIPQPEHTISGNASSHNQLSSLLEGRIGETPTQALAGVATWVHSVVNALKSMQWQLIGYELLNTSGTKQKPLYRCPACWAYKDAANSAHQPNCMIYHAISSYDNSVCTDLQTVMHSIDSNSIKTKKGSVPVPVMSKSASVRSLSPPTLSSVPSFLPQHISGGLWPFSSSANDFLGTFDLNFNMDSLDTDVLNQAEQQVASVLLWQSQYGFPCFSLAGLVVGFYQHRVESELVFLPLEKNATQEQLEFPEIYAEYRKGTSKVLTLKDHVTLDKLKEQILFGIWEQEASQANSFFSLDT